MDVLSAWLTFAVSTLGDALSPPCCAACDALLKSRAVFCPACATTIVHARHTDVRAFGVYGGALAVAIRRLKYEGRPFVAAPLGQLLRQITPADAIDLVVPVPLHPKRLAERGYNQAALLARSLTSIAPFAPRALRRVRDTPKQAQLDRAGRAVNVADAFVVARREAVAGKRVALVDDVVTTGATLAACRRALEQAGAREVVPIALARAD